MKSFDHQIKLSLTFNLHLYPFFELFPEGVHIDTGTSHCVSFSRVNFTVFYDEIHHSVHSRSRKCWEHQLTGISCNHIFAKGCRSFPRFGKKYQFDCRSPGVNGKSNWIVDYCVWYHYKMFSYLFGVSHCTCCFTVNITPHQKLVMTIQATCDWLKF